MQLDDLYFTVSGLEKINQFLRKFQQSLATGYLPKDNKGDLFDQCDQMLDTISEIKRLIALRSK